MLRGMVARLLLLCVFSIPFAIEPAPLRATEPAREPAAELGSGAVSVTGSADADSDRERPRIGVALAGGSALGFAHVGVLRELERIGIPIDYVAGTSMGAVVGGLYAIGYSPDELEQIIAETNWAELFRDELPRTALEYRERQTAIAYFAEIAFGREGVAFSPGLMSGQRIYRLLAELSYPYTDTEQFDTYPRPFRAVATDLVTGAEVVLDSGSLADAIRASIAISGIFTPLEIDGRPLVDGGAVNNLPVEVVRGMGADIVIAVDLTRPEITAAELSNPLAVIDQTISVMIEQNKLEQRALADLIIEPDLRGYSSVSFREGAALIRRGEQAVREQQGELTELRELLGSPQSDRDVAPAGEIAGLLSDGPGRGRRAGRETLQIRSIELENAMAGDDERIRRELALASGATLTLEEIHTAVDRAYKTGRYEMLRYRLEPEEDDRHRLVLTPQYAPQARNTVRFGISFESRFDELRDDLFHLNVNLTVRDLTGPGSYWITDLRFVNSRLLRSEYIQPIVSPLFLAPSIALRDNWIVLYDDGFDAIEEYRTRGAAAQIRLGAELFRTAELYAGLRADRVETERVFSNQPTGFDEFEGGIVSMIAGLGSDSLDRFPFPRSGAVSRLEYDRSEPVLGSDLEYSRLLLDHRRYLSPVDRHTFGLHLLAGSSFAESLEAHNAFMLGGREQFTGYYRNADWGNQLGVLGLEYRYRVPALERPLRRAVYLRVRGNLGNVWTRPLNDLVDDAGRRKLELRYGGGVGLGFDTWLGAFNADLGLGDHGRVVFYLSIGRHF